MSTAAGLMLAAAGSVPADARTDPDGWRDAAISEALRTALDDGDGTAVLALAAGYDELLLLAPAELDGEVLLQGVGNAERRHRGAFSTPPDFARDLARRALPAPVSGVLDPACGAGALLRAALERLLGQGVPVVEALVALHGVDADPVAVALCRASLAALAVAAGHPGTAAVVAGAVAARVRVGDALLGPTPEHPDVPGFAWHREFPAVLAGDGDPEPVTGWRGGFGAVLANPPWERLKVHARDWSGAPPAGLRDRRAELARALRAGGRHPLTGTGELNAYLPFVETCWRLLAPDGRAAVLVPAGIASDRSAARLVEALVDAGALHRLHLFEPETPVFAGVSARVAVAVLELGRRPGEGRMAVGLPHLDAPVTGREFALTPGLLRLVNPNTRTAPPFSSPADAELVAAVHRRVPVLLRRAADGEPAPDPDGWQVRMVTSLHMTRDARWFADAPGPGLVPLWEAKHCGLLDPYGAGRPHRYWVPAELMAERYPDLTARGWLAGFRNVSLAGSPRTLVPVPLPVAGVGNSLPLLHAPRLPLLLAALSTLPVDHLLRQRHAGANVNFFKLEQVPVPPPAAYDAPAPWAPGRTVGDWVLDRLARAVVWPESGLEGLATELGATGRSVDDAARAAARADLDAAHAVLLGLDRAGLAHVLGTFGALRARETAAAGRFVTAERVLAAFDRLCPVPH